MGKLFDIFKRGEEKRKLNETKLRDDRCIPVAREILGQIAQHELPMGNIKEGDIEAYNVIAEIALAVILRNNINWADRHYIWQIIKQTIEFTEEKVMTSLDKSYEYAMQSIWGKDMMDLQMSDIDSKLKELKEEYELEPLTDKDMT